MKSSIRELVAAAGIRTEADLMRHIALMEATNAFMRMDDLAELVGSVAPDMVDQLTTMQMQSSLLLESTKWSDNWKQWWERDSTHVLTTQYVERMAQMKPISPLNETGDRYAEVAPPQGTELSYTIGGFGNTIGVDFRTIRSDRHNYWKKLGEIFGRGGMSRLHTFLYVTMLQGNPTLAEDSNTLFDDTNHGNDCDSNGTGKPLTYDNFRAGIRRMDRAVDAASEPLDNEHVIIIAGRYWRDAAEELQSSPNRPGTANRDENLMKKRIAGVDISAKLGYDWYLAGVELPKPLINFLDGHEVPVFEQESSSSSYKFETEKTRYKLSQWYGGVHQRPIQLVRGSTNVLAS